MSSKFAGVTFDDQAATPSDDAIIRRAILADGILTGCEVSYTGSTLTMTAGQLMICGRQVKHPSTQNWAVADATTGFARLVLTIDLTRTSSKDTFEQVVDTVEYASAVDGFADLVQEDINASGTKYQIVAAVVSLTTGGISGIVSQLGQTSAVMGEKSVIIVDNLPTGSTVTCTKGTVTKTAAERNGEWWFKGLEIGTWTLRAEKDGEQPVTQKFEITEFGVYRVHMSFFTATIKVTYPAGSTCTCSKGDEVLTAGGTSGVKTFTVTSAGTWVIKITSGKYSASKSVSITKTGQSVSVSIDYTLWLFKDGDQFTENTGGWHSRPDFIYRSNLTPNGTVTIGNTISMQAGSGQSATAWTVNKIDLTQYKTLSVIADKASGSQDINIMPASATQIENQAVAWTRIETAGETTLDVSNISGEYYVVFAVAVNRSYSVSEAKLLI